jgi:hypothetical protein
LAISYIIIYEKNGCEIIQYVINFICAIPKLRKLNLSDTNIIDDNIKCLLLKGKNIYDLNISHCNNLTDDFMYFIASFPNLQNLNLSYSCKITEKGISHLSNNNNLLNLNLSNFCSANNSLIHISKIKNLERLDITNLLLDFNNIKYLINNKKLNTLYISAEYENDIKKHSISKIKNIFYQPCYIHSCFPIYIYYKN